MPENVCVPSQGHRSLGALEPTPSHGHASEILPALSNIPSLPPGLFSTVSSLLQRTLSLERKKRNPCHTSCQHGSCFSTECSWGLPLSQLPTPLPGKCRDEGHQVACMWANPLTPSGSSSFLTLGRCGHSGSCVSCQYPRALCARMTPNLGMYRDAQHICAR